MTDYLPKFLALKKFMLFDMTSGIENKRDIYSDLAYQPNPCPKGQSIPSSAGRHIQTTPPNLRKLPNTYHS
jgi:hypothetical protein